MSSRKILTLFFFLLQAFDISALVILLIQGFFAYNIFFIMHNFTPCTPP